MLCAQERVGFLLGAGGGQRCAKLMRSYHFGPDGLIKTVLFLLLAVPRRSQHGPPGSREVAEWPSAVLVLSSCAPAPRRGSL